MIVTQATITVSGDKASLDVPLYFYRGDGDHQLVLTIKKQSHMTLGYYNNTEDDLVSEFGTEFARACIYKPETIVYKKDEFGNTLIDENGNPIPQPKLDENGNPIPDQYEMERQMIITDPIGLDNGRLVFVLSRTYIDEFTELGIYDMQIHLYDQDPDIIENYNPEDPSSRVIPSRLTIPPVQFEVKDPMCQHVPYFNENDFTGTKIDPTLGQAAVNLAIVKYNAAKANSLKVFDEDNWYIKTPWTDGMIIHQNDMNKLELGVWWTAYYNRLVRDTRADLADIDKTYIVEGTQCYIKNEHEPLIWYDGDWHDRNQALLSTVETNFNRCLSDATISPFLHSHIQDFTAFRDATNNQLSTLENAHIGDVEHLLYRISQHIGTDDLSNMTYNNHNDLNNKIAGIESDVNLKLYISDFNEEKNKLQGQINQLGLDINQAYADFEAADEQLEKNYKEADSELEERLSESITKVDTKVITVENFLKNELPTTYATKTELEATNTNISEVIVPDINELKAYKDKSTITHATKEELNKAIDDTKDWVSDSIETSEATMNDKIANREKFILGELDKHEKAATKNLNDNYYTKPQTETLIASELHSFEIEKINGKLATSNELNIVKSDLNNTQNEIENITNNYATKVEVVQKDVIDVKVNNSTLQLTMDVCQCVKLENEDVLINLPSMTNMNKSIEMHVYMDVSANIGDPRLRFADTSIKWQDGEINIEPGSVCEFIFTWLPSIGWLGGYLTYMSNI